MAAARAATGTRINMPCKASITVNTQHHHRNHTCVIYPQGLRRAIGDALEARCAELAELGDPLPDEGKSAKWVAPRAAGFMHHSTMQLLSACRSCSLPANPPLLPANHFFCLQIDVLCRGAYLLQKLCEYSERFAAMLEGRHQVGCAAWPVCLRSLCAVVCAV